MIDLIQKVLHKGDSHTVSSSGPVIVCSVESLSAEDSRVKLSVFPFSNPTRGSFKTRKAGTWVDYCEVTEPSKVKVVCDAGIARVLVTAGTEIPEDGETVEAPKIVAAPVTPPPAPEESSLEETPVEEVLDNSELPVDGNDEETESDAEEEADWGMPG